MKWKKIMLISFFILSVLFSMSSVQSIPLFDSDDVVFGVGNQNYTLTSDTESIDCVYVADSWIRFNTTDFNVTSTNDINITLSYLDDNIAGASAGDTVLSFNASSSVGLVYFNLSGFSPSTVYTLYRDDAAVNAYTADASGVLNMTNTVWSDHDFDVKTGSFDGSRTVQINYEHDLLGATYTKGVSTISMFSLIMVFMALGVGFMFFMMIKGGRN